MKFDLHCHTQEGSLDGKLPIAEYIRLLQEKGYDGMLVTDHNSYKGYRAYRDILKEKLHNFVVLKGIEYDTIDAGHILVIMPEQVKLKLLECRGLPVRILQDIVHRHGGILGPAHPCGERHLSFTQTKAYKRHPEIMKKFDFVEGFNSCESDESNARAIELAKSYDLPTFGGSDSHHADCVGTAYTELPQTIAHESDLIACVKSKLPLTTGGYKYKGTVKQKIGTAIFSLEMSNIQLINRMLSLETNIEAQKFRKGDLTAANWDNLIDGADTLAASSLIIDETPSISITELRSRCRKYKAEYDIGLIIIDYLQLMTGGGKSNSRQEEVAEISRSLKAIARELNVPVIALSQLSRSLESRQDKRPMLSDLRESGSIEQDADVVMFIYRDDYYDKDSEQKNIAEIIVAKQRNGPVQTVKLGWIPQQTKFVNLARPQDM